MNREWISDRDARIAAETTFDHNVVVIAGAGTGKTTLLVNRLVHLLMKEPHPIGITELIALSFTNKAATEMKVRLRERLIVLADPGADPARSSDGGAVPVDDLKARYGLTRAQIADRAGTALRDIEKAQIGTLHGFAAHLLRLHPLESELDPAFQEDDGLRFDEHFRQAWDLWIDRELSRGGTCHHLWRRLLPFVSLDEIEKLARSLCSDLVDLDVLRRQLDSSRLDATMIEWITRLHDKAGRLLESHDRPKRRKIEHMLACAKSLLAALLRLGPPALRNLDSSSLDWLDKKVGERVDGWEETDFEEATRLIGIVRDLRSVDHDFFNDLLRLVAPFAVKARDSFAEKGWLTFDGLLARARRLLWDHRLVRERIKRDYRAVLVDEFQDTDPVQYEIILAVCEQNGFHALGWQEMRLEPGKLFIVGDPKQSIYAFRRADIEAFDRVVDKIVGGRGRAETLTTNFRSNAAVLGPINEIFDRLFIRSPLVQPANVRLEVRPQEHAPTSETGVQLLITAPSTADEPFDAAAAVRAEGEVLARWLKEEILTRPGITAGQVALLFRKLTQADAYLDALRRYDIAYVIEGEKHFYRRQEVVELINVLRVLDHPHDRIALVGVLRSPLGGLTDRDLCDFHQANLLDYLAQGIDRFDHPRAPAIRRLYRRLANLRREIAAYPIEEAIELVFDRLPILELAAASLHGEQAVANLLKVKQTAASLSDRPHMTLSGFVDVMVERLDKQPEEAESPLVEESFDAVKILTIHKSKGLEFPVVVLPALHQGSGRDRDIPPVVYEWSTDSYGLSLGKRRTLGAVLAHAKFSVREEAERRRVLYVGMTRAKEQLVLSGGLVGRAVGETTLEWLQALTQTSIGDAAAPALEIGKSVIAQRVVLAPDRKWPGRPLSHESSSIPVDAQAVARLWQEREVRWNTVRKTRWRLTPTSLAKQAADSVAGTQDHTGNHDAGRLAGIIAHLVLERWNFRSDPAELQDQIDQVLRVSLAHDERKLTNLVQESLRRLFETFGRSALYARLREATILGREVPFLMPWGEGQVMEGVIDVIYRRPDGTIWIADYKSDMVEAVDAEARAERYAPQAAIYREAARSCLGMPTVSFEFMFLRPGVSVIR